MSCRIFSREFSIVISMSCWNSGLACRRLAFFIISDNCVTMFFRSCTTKADMRLKASNLRASSRASVACICARKLAACRPAVLSRSLTSQFTSTLGAGAGQHDEADQLVAHAKRHDQPGIAQAQQPGRQRQRVVATRNGAVLLQVDDPAGAHHELAQAARPRPRARRTAPCSSAPSGGTLLRPGLFNHRPPAGLSSMSARPRMTCSPIVLRRALRRQAPA